MRSFAFLQHIVTWAFVKQICNCEPVQFCFWAAVLSKQCNLQTRKPIMYTLSHCIGCTIYTVHTVSTLHHGNHHHWQLCYFTIWARGCCVSYGHNHSSRAQAGHGATFKEEGSDFIVRVFSSSFICRTTSHCSWQRERIIRHEFYAKLQNLAINFTHQRHSGRFNI